LCLYGSDRRSHNKCTHQITHHLYTFFLTFYITSLDFAYHFFTVENTHNFSTF
jgi:hypothetical protein